MKWHATQPRARGKKLECGVGSRVKCDLYGVELRLSAAIGWELSERQGIGIFVGCDDGRFLQIPKSRATAGDSSLESLRPCPSAPWRSLSPVTGAAQSHRLHLVHHLLHRHLHDIEAVLHPPSLRLRRRLPRCGMRCRNREHNPGGAQHRCMVFGPHVCSLWFGSYWLGPAVTPAVTQARVSDAQARVRSPARERLASAGR